MILIEERCFFIVDIVVNLKRKILLVVLVIFLFFFLALFKPQPTSIKTTPGKKSIVSVQNLAYRETSRRLDTSKTSDVMSDVKYLIFERS